MPRRQLLDEVRQALEGETSLAVDVAVDPQCRLLCGWTGGELVHSRQPDVAPLALADARFIWTRPGYSA